MYSRLGHKFVFLVFCLLLIEGFVAAGQSTNTITVNDDNKIHIPNLNQYQVHNPIFIGDNEDFAALGFSGFGTIDDPYLIEGLNITSTGYFALILIENTNAHVVIRNSILNGLKGTEMGIALYNVINARIENNTIFDNAVQQVQIDQSSNNTIVANTISGTEISSQGILIVDYSQESPSEYNFILNNTISANPDYGIGIQGSHNNYIAGNTLFMNNHGIFIWQSDYNHIEGNQITNNDNGISLPQGNENIIQNNDFIGNNYQIVDNGANNLIENNYYDDWSGIGPYSIAGSAGNQDISPRTSPNQWTPNSTTIIYVTTTLPVTVIETVTQSSSGINSNLRGLLIIAIVVAMGVGIFKLLQKPTLEHPRIGQIEQSNFEDMNVDIRAQNISQGAAEQVASVAKFCSTCGEGLPAVVDFCGNCGAKVGK